MGNDYLSFGMDYDLGTHFKPSLLTSSPLVFSPSMLQIISAAERYFSRIDERVTHSPFRASIKSTLINLEALSSAAIDGAEIDLSELLISTIGQVLDESGKSEKHGLSLCRARHYRELIAHHCSQEDMKDFRFSQESVFKLHAELSYANPDLFHPAFRGENVSNPEVLHPRLPQSRTVTPQDIGPYMEDLCTFCNSDEYSPQIQASLAHFQLEYIRPFKSDINTLGRHISYIVYARRKFADTIIMPVAMTSLQRVDSPIDNLRATENALSQRPLGLWVYHGAAAMLAVTRTIEDMETRFAEIQCNWKDRLDGLKKSTIGELLLSELFIHPIINTTFVVKMSGKTFPAVNEAIDKMVDRGVLYPLNDYQRYRYFVAKDIIGYYYSVFDKVLPKHWTPGTKLFES